MAGKKSVIETGVDKLVRLISERKKVSVRDAAKELGVSVSNVEEWADFLEDEGIISIQTQFATVYLVEKKLGKKEIEDKVKAVKAEKDAFMRRVESSINALERDSEEIKLIDEEFKKIREMLEKKFSTLGKKLDQLEDFKKSHHQIAVRFRELESDHEGRLKKLDSRMKSEEKRYRDMIKGVEEDSQRMKDDEKKLSEMKNAEKTLQAKVDEVNRLLDSVRKEIEDGNKKIKIDEARLKGSEKSANTVKDEIEMMSKELEEASKQFTESRKELESMEKTFLADLEKLGKGDLEKIGSYKESQNVIEKFKSFFEQTRDVELMIHKAEKEEEELKAHFDELGKKVRAFSVITSVPEIKKEVGALQQELLGIEREKGVLTGQLKKLRTVVRSLVK